jgi:DNA-binding NtrC family response regulator
VAESHDSTLSMNPAKREPEPGRAPHLFLLLECERPTAGSSRHSLEGIDEVVIGRGAEREVMREGARLELRVPDARLSSKHARIVREGSRLVLEDMGSKNGSLTNGVRHRCVELADGDVVELGYTFFLFRASMPASGVRDAVVGAGLVSMVPSVQRQLDEVKAIAQSAAPVLVLGETGTGKELVARAVHQYSGRSGAFVAVNCGAIATNLVESELFGHKKGAFSGATEDRPGLVRSAHGGTLFLDEIGDLPSTAQAALLRVLQEREVLPVGATKPISVDARVVSATHRDLEALSAAGQFRSDLLGRLRGFEVRLPPLRERREDLGLIAAALCARLAPELTFAPEAMRALVRYGWPLNVRELEQCLTTAAALSGGHVTLAHLPGSLTGAAPPAPAPPQSLRIRPLTDEEEQRRQELVALFEKHRGNLSAVARELGKDRVQIRRWVKLYRIDTSRFEH